MRKRPLRRPSPALVIACVALLVALTGTSYATVLNVPRASVGTPQLKRNAVKARQLAPNAVRSAHVLNGSLLAADFRAGQIPQGPKGDKGDAGPPGVSGYEVVTAMVTVNNTRVDTSVSCPGGKRVLGGGVRSNAWALGVGPYVTKTYPNGAGTAWLVEMARHSAAANTTVIAYAICANVAS